MVDNLMKIPGFAYGLNLDLLVLSHETDLSHNPIAGRFRASEIEDWGDCHTEDVDKIITAEYRREIALEMIRRWAAWGNQE